MPLYYHKTDSLRWIDGSIRQDLEPDERSVWADLMALAGLTREPRRGYIERSKGIPYPKDVILSRLNITEELFDRAVRKCVKEGRLKVFPNGTMLLTNWNKYNNVDNLETKKAIKQAGIEKSKQNKRTVTNAVEALTRAVNELNKKTGETRYVIREDMILDTKTGETKDIKTLRN